MKNRYDYNMKNDTPSKAGLSVAGVVQVVFLILKLCGLINWSWWLVLLPTFISVGLTILLVGIAILLAIFWKQK